MSSRASLPPQVSHLVGLGQPGRLPRWCTTGVGSAPGGGDDREGAGVNGSHCLETERDSWGTSELSQPDHYMTIMAQGGLGEHWRMVLCQLLGPALQAGTQPGREVSDPHSWSLSIGTRGFPRQIPVLGQDSGIPLSRKTN